MSTMRPSDNTISFIVSTPARQSVEEKRKLIRSHVMRGKNRKMLPTRPPSWIDANKANDRKHPKQGLDLCVPANVGGQFSFTAFSAEISPDMLEAIWELKRLMFPIEFGLDSYRSESSWLEPICGDAACLHFTVFIAKEYLNVHLRQKESSKTTLVHLVKTLAILQQRLASGDNELSTSDYTILVVVGLTLAATGLRDLETAVKHLKGLHKMVILRGGISAFQWNRSLQTKIFRADLGVALSTGRKPLFFSDGVSWDSYIASQGKIPALRAQDSDSDPQIPASGLGIFLDSLDTRLRSVWDDVSEFVRAANIASQCKRGIDSDLYQEVMISIHYRLVNLCFDRRTINEITRLALMAFASTLFLQWRGVRVRYECLAQSLKRALTLLGHSPGVIPHS
ncbi:uncharacterized protein BDZ99DRAFT_501563 [Mytilinidion resinicola]|uniref:Transcription factor domain-containing protein n=1 Tax=Mytilinidion resinicola TaxID=574789 RepID=A0A6A6YBZ7_9PEZI|nr:uncharacterized protein BDZ99DRAFT_501563 [Mytilinidion resinicola]KAF2806033.1 hypothetical protein BDZ99DRAFT_501563 [Mytilinidion resinicola]